MAKTEKQPISWESMEFKHYHKSIGWYVSLYCIAFLLIIFEVFQRDLFAAITILIITVFVVIFSKQRPRTLNITLSTQGIHIDNIHIPYKQIKHFWIVDTPNHKTLNIETTAYFHNTAIIELADQEPEEIRKFLAPHLYEHEDTEPTFAQRVMHRLKF